MAPPIIVARGVLPLPTGPGNAPPAIPAPTKTPAPTVAPSKPPNTPPPSKTSTQPPPASKPAPTVSKSTTTRAPASNTGSSINSASNSQSSVSNTATTPNTVSNTPPASYTAPPGASDDGGVSTTVAPPSFSIPSPSIDPSGTAVGSNSNASAAPSGGMSTTMIIGIAAGGLVGIALLVAIVSFMVRRCSKRKHQEALGDVFDRQEFKRNSIMVPDEAPSRQSSGRRTGPRPPTMIDRHLNHRPLAQPQHDLYSTGYPPYQQGGYGGYNQGYGQQPYYPPQPSLSPGDVLAPPGGFGGYDSPAQSPIRDAFSPSSASSSAPFLNHQLTGTGPRSLTPQSDLSHLGRGQSVTPYQAVQYAEIGRQLSGPPEAPTTPVEAYARLDRQPSPTHSGGQQHRYRTAAYQPQRPVSNYENEDAYGGI